MGDKSLKGMNKWEALIEKYPETIDFVDMEEQYYMLVAEYKSKVNDMKKREFIIKRIVDIVNQTAPNSELYLYGSRARGTSKKSSDWDLLILLNFNCFKVQRICQQSPYYIAKQI